ncbi:MAG: energy-coupling factor ABC transporter ATP-binding protein [Ignavibacteriales bacterium]|nr:energy-coupling factor ABC transporter ATP-binding protein [Ignavibacteriales bacterium]
MIPIIEVQNLHYRYHDGTEALRGVSFKINEGECVGLIGPNGAGKSTILLHLNGLLPENKPRSPAILLAGQPITDESLLEVHKFVGLLFQNPDDQLFCPTVSEDVAFGPKQFGEPEEVVRNLVQDALNKVGLSGYDNRSAHHLSGGEKQRVCIAGILACQPRLFALDEPTKDLDPRGRRELKKLLKSIPTTKIIASHDLEMITELCSRTLVLDRGKIVADGPTVDLLSNEELMLVHGLEKPHILKHRHPHL